MLARYHPSTNMITIQRANGTVLCQIPYGHAVVHPILLDEHIKACKMRRDNSKWIKHDTRFETKVRFK